MHIIQLQTVVTRKSFRNRDRQPSLTPKVLGFSFPSKKTSENWLGGILSAAIGGVISTLATATPSLGADKIAFYYPPFGEFTISTDSLEAFAKEGRITDEFSFYTSRIPKEQLGELREVLQTKFAVSPILVSQFTYAPIGEKLLQRLGELLLNDSRQNGFYALRSALILAAADKEGLTLVNAIRRYPSNTIRLNLGETLGIVDNLSELLKRRDAIVAGIKQTALSEAANNPKIDFAQQPDLRRPGTLKLEKIALELNDTTRKRNFSVDLYLPQPQQQNIPSPVIVVSHGVAEDRETFAYLAQHLASYGFAVAIIEHPGSDAKKFQQYFSGLAGPPEANELLDRPLDVKFLLDDLQRRSESDANLKGRLNLQQVGAIGHSLGGYTVLALSGANIDFEQVNKDCFPNRSLNLSVFLQCRAGELRPDSYQLSDPRIKAVMALNPLNSTVLGRNSLSQIQIPAMFVASSQDIFTPAVPEQIRPFTWLKTRDKYLVLIENGTHFSVSEKLNAPNDKVLPVPESLIGPNPALAQTYVKALSVALFESHLLNQQQYAPYLSASYAQFISQEPLNLSLLSSFTEEQLGQFFSGQK